MQIKNEQAKSKQTKSEQIKSVQAQNAQILEQKPAKQKSAKQKEVDQKPADQKATIQKSASAKKNSAKKFTKGDIVKFCVLIGIVAAGIVLTIALWPYIMKFTTQEGMQELISIVQNTGPAAVLTLLALQFLQVIVAFIPGEIVQLAAGVLYGPVWGSVIILAGAFGSTIIIYYVVQKLGAPFVHKMVSKEHQKKLDFIIKTPRIDAIVFVLFLIPGLPKDVITYLIALTDVRPSRFFIFSTAGRIPGVVASSFAGSSIADGNWMMLVVIGVVVGAILLVSFLCRDKIMARFNNFANDEAKGE